MGSEAGVLRIALCDEGASTENLALNMLLAALASVLDKDIRLGIVGDPCRVKPSLPTLKCTSSLHVACAL